MYTISFFLPIIRYELDESSIGSMTQTSLVYRTKYEQCDINLWFNVADKFLSIDRDALAYKHDHEWIWQTRFTKAEKRSDARIF